MNCVNALIFPRGNLLNFDILFLILISKNSQKIKHISISFHRDDSYSLNKKKNKYYYFLMKFIIKNFIIKNLIINFIKISIMN